mmetsp:Transcript_14000/g.42147  ORF Transcript_14000/g.42147 Transcript_14000/m.42147 type:complete len:257 (-) Transcript_14000:293-1063(-)
MLHLHKDGQHCRRVRKGETDHRQCQPRLQASVGQTVASDTVVGDDNSTLDHHHHHDEHHKHHREKGSHAKIVDVRLERQRKDDDGGEAHGQQTFGGQQRGGRDQRVGHVRDEVTQQHKVGDQRAKVADDGNQVHEHRARLTEGPIGTHYHRACARQLRRHQQQVGAQCAEERYHREEQGAQDQTHVAECRAHAQDAGADGAVGQVEHGAQEGGERTGGHQHVLHGGQAVQMEAAAVDATQIGVCTACVSHLLLSQQ